MADMGWIKLYRQLQESAIWTTDEPFDKRSAWISLLLMANHENRETPSGARIILVKRGQKFTTEQHLADMWHWSRKKVRNFLKLLQSAGMITVNSTRYGTMISIVNYSLFQESRNQPKNRKRTTSEPQGNREGYPNKNNTRMIENDKENSAPRADPWGNEFE